MTLTGVPVSEISANQLKAERPKSPSTSGPPRTLLAAGGASAWWPASRDV